MIRRRSVWALAIIALLIPGCTIGTSKAGTFGVRLELNTVGIEFYHETPEYDEGKFTITVDDRIIDSVFDSDDDGEDDQSVEPDKPTS